MVFLVGDPYIKPWQESYSKMLILLRMCLASKKYTFAVASAMEALVYLAASSLDRNIKIINGPEGGKIT
jgi:hypothetical protein